MAENKTKPTAKSVDRFLGGVAGEGRRKDCKALVKLMTRVAKAKPVMWGPSIVGFGTYHYRYESGREGDMCIAGFSPRKTDLTLYISTRFAQREPLLKKLGKHRTGKSCLYIKRLDDVDLAVLEELIRCSVEAVTGRAEPGGC